MRGVKKAMDCLFLELPLWSISCCGPVVIEALGWGADRRLLVTGRCRQCGQRVERVASLDSDTYDDRQPGERFWPLQPWVCATGCGEWCEIVKIEAAPDSMLRLRFKCPTCGCAGWRVYDLNMNGYVLRAADEGQRSRKRLRMQNWGSYRGQSAVWEPGDSHMSGYTDPYDWSA